MTQSNVRLDQYLKANLKILLLPLLCIFIVCFLPTLFYLWERWFARDSYYSHGILIPFVTGYLIWQLKDELKSMQVERNKWGMVLIVFGVLVHSFSILFRIYFSSGFAMLFVFWGMVLHFFGWKIFKKILFPLFFLFFMVPLPLFVIVNISFKLKLMAAEIATYLLNAMGIFAQQTGSIIRMKNAQVTVDDVCSGLRSLISLTALGSIFAYWLEGAVYKKLFLFLSTIPIAIITNVCRIIFLSGVSEIWGTQYATGLVHDLAGFSVFGLAFVMLAIMGKIIE